MSAPNTNQEFVKLESSGVGACECLCVCLCACLWLICSLRNVEGLAWGQRGASVVRRGGAEENGKSVPSREGRILPSTQDHDAVCGLDQGFSDSVLLMFWVGDSHGELGGCPMHFRMRSSTH